MPDQFEALDREIFEGTDRSCVLICGAMVDSGLEAALRVCFVKYETEAEHNELFRNENAPLLHLAAKMKIARSIGLITHDHYRVINIIRQVRNVFAHSFLPLTFDHPEIAAECAKLPDGWEKTHPKISKYKNLSSHRLKFTACGAQIGSELERYAEENGGLEIKLRMTDKQLPALRAKS